MTDDDDKGDGNLEAMVIATATAVRDGDGSPRLR